jgi:HJR/Mrr/RecB family endonuclease
MGNILDFIIILILFSHLSIALAAFARIFLLSRKRNKDLARYAKAVISLEDLYNLTPGEFEEWCKEYLESIGFSDVELMPSGPDGGKELVCTRDGLKYYIECKRYDPDINAYYRVDAEVVKKLLGAMVHDGVSRGIIITTGIATRGALRFIGTLPQDYKINLVDGEDLIESSRQLEWNALA